MIGRPARHCRNVRANLSGRKSLMPRTVCAMGIGDLFHGQCIDIVAWVVAVFGTVPLPLQAQ
jgi:hypothetical protein